MLDLKRAMDALRASEENHRVLLDESSDPIFKFDADGRYLYVNHEFAHKIGLTQKDVIGRRIWDIFSKEEADLRFAVLTDVFASGQTRVFPVRIDSPGGERHLITTAKPIFDADGRPTAVFCISKDVTDLKRAEDATRQAQEKLQLIADAVPAVVCQFSRSPKGEWRSLYVSKGVVGLFEVDVDAALRDHGLLTRCIHPSDAHAYRESLERSFAELGEWDHWYRILTPGGAIRWVRGRASPRRQADGSVVWTGTLADVTERKRIEEAVHAASRAKSEFLANVSHEIRTPMNAILGMTAVIQRKSRDPDLQDKLDVIDTAARHLLGVINSILDLSKIEAGKLVLEEAPLRVESVVGNVIAMLANRASAKGISLSAQVPALPDDLAGDAGRLQQALLNYAHNAVKFTTRGSVVLKVIVEEEGAASVLLRFEVRDTGLGVPAEALPRLFGNFEQGDSSTTRRFGGTGLGLAITKNIARLMGGDAGARSVHQVGSTFWFTARFRRMRADAGGSAGPRDAASATATPDEVLLRDHLGARVLLAEDDPVNREITIAMLDDAGLAVTVAEDGLQAVDRASCEDFDLILMDLRMPGLDGLNATHRIRELPAHRATPIVALTANAFDEDRERCLAAGMDGFIAKPVAPLDLYGTILEVLRTGRGKPNAGGH